MPEFPRYQSKATPTTQQPSVQAVDDTSPEMIQAAGNVVSTATEAALKWDSAVKSTRKTVALTNYKSDVLDIQQRASAELDPNKIKDYQAELEKSRARNADGLDELSALELNYESKVAGIQLDNLFRKKTIELDQVATKRAIAMEVNNPTPSSFPKIQALLREKLAMGLIDPATAYAEEVRANDDIGVNRINKDLYQARTPDEVDAITQRITSGEYEAGGVTIDPDKKKALLEIADRAKANTEKKIKAQEVDAMAQNRVETVLGVATGDIDPQTANITEIAEYDPKLAALLIKAKEFMRDYNPKDEDPTLSMAGVLTLSEAKKARGYAESIEDVFMTNDNEKLGEFVLRELEKQGDGTNSSTKLAAFMQLAALKVKANNPKGPDDRFAINALNSIKNGFKFLKSTNPYLFPQAAQDFIVKVFANGSITKEQVMEDARSTLESIIIDRYSSVAKLPSLPNKIVDGEASVEDLQDGINDLDGDEFIGDYDDAPSD